MYNYFSGSTTVSTDNKYEKVIGMKVKFFSLMGKWDIQSLIGELRGLAETRSNSDYKYTLTGFSSKQIPFIKRVNIEFKITSNKPLDNYENSELEDSTQLLDDILTMISTKLRGIKVSLHRWHKGSIIIELSILKEDGLDLTQDELSKVNALLPTFDQTIPNFLPFECQSSSKMVNLTASVEFTITIESKKPYDRDHLINFLREFPKKTTNINIEKMSK